MLITTLLADLSLKHAEVANRFHTKIGTPESVRKLHTTKVGGPDDESGAYVIGAQKIEFSHPDLLCYQTTLDLLTQIYNYYPNILGDMIYKIFNDRTNQHLQMEEHNEQHVMIRQWLSHGEQGIIEATQLACSKYTMVVLTIDRQSLVALQISKGSWEYFSSKQHCKNLGLLPYMVDLFAKGKVEDVRMPTPLANFLDNCLPSWYNLIR